MLFGTIEFYIFFIATLLSWLSSPVNFRWFILLLASYIFYFSWQPWYCLILLFNTLVTWSLCGWQIRIENVGLKKVLLASAIIINCLPLLYFKYFIFINDSIAALFSPFGVSSLTGPLDIILPVGISFYSFQAISYCIDIYRGETKFEHNLGKFSLYLSFFPKLISGPIERGESLLPQIRNAKQFEINIFISGIRIFLWGLFKKIVIADRLAMYADMVFAHPQDYFGITVLIAIWFFSLQIYCDFSAYTDMAIGCGRMFGIELSQNFNFPYFARSINEFWQRWHITLTSWFRDYLYIPLGGNRVEKKRIFFNILTVFVVSGLWHGAAWNFVFWGAIHGVLYLLEKYTFPLRKKVVSLLGFKDSILYVVQVFITFNLVSLAWVFFRAANISDAFVLLGNLFVNMSLPARMMSSQFTTFLAFGFAILFITLEIIVYWQSKNNFTFFKIIPAFIKFPIYAIALLTISLFGVSSSEFIYFHF